MSYVHSSIVIILMGKRELVALLNLSSWCLVMVDRLFLTVPQDCLRFVIVVFPDHTHLLFSKNHLCHKGCRLNMYYSHFSLSKDAVCTFFINFFQDRKGNKKMVKPVLSGCYIC